MNQVHIVVSALGFSLSIVTLVISLQLESVIGSLRLEISKRAFFVLDEVYIKQLPNFHGLIFAVFFALLVYRIHDYYAFKHQLAQTTDFESQYLVKLKVVQSLEWGNIVMTSIFTLLTLGLALGLSTYFSLHAKDEAIRVVNMYSAEPAISERDLNTFDDLESEYGKIDAIAAIDIVTLVLLGVQVGLSLVQKYQLKKSL